MDALWVGLLVGFVVAAVIARAERIAFRDRLIESAKPDSRVAEQIGQDYYYIVPEHEYASLQLQASRTAALAAFARTAQGRLRAIVETTR